MANTRGFGGGIGGDPGDEGEAAAEAERLVPRRPAADDDRLWSSNLRALTTQDVAAMQEMFAKARDDVHSNLTEIDDRVNATMRALTQAEELSAQQAGQIARLEATLQQLLAQWQQDRQTIDARLGAMAQRLGGNMRYHALELATKARQPAEAAAKVVAAAEAYLRFLDPSPEGEDKIVPPELAFGPATTH